MRDMDIKLVFVDLDGTMLQGMETLTPRTIRAFARLRERGIAPVIATGRPVYEAAFAARAIGAEGYFIVMNGAAVYKNFAAGELLCERHLPPAAVSEVYRLLSGEDVFFEMYAEGRSICQADMAGRVRRCGMSEEQTAFFSKMMLAVEDLPSYITEKELHVHKFFLSLEDPQKIPALRRKLEQVPGVRTLTSGAHFVEAVPEDVDKRSAVRAVREALGLSKEQVMVIGDSENDLGMFDEAAVRVAMGNACPELKAKADCIAPSNMEDGVAWALETLLLGEPGPHPFTGRVECLGAEAIDRALAQAPRQYLAGDLKRPQALAFLRDTAVEVGLNRCQDYRWEAPHYHTTTSEYCYMLAGETKYVDLSAGKEYHFREGDFFILRRDTPYLQKSLPGFRMIFVKAPGLDDKVKLPMDAQMEAWCVGWDVPWDASPGGGAAGPD